MSGSAIATARRAFLGMSHSPLLGLNPVAADDQIAIDKAIAAARAAVHEFSPELIVLLGPDHYNGFFNELMPPFCIGSQATAVGDYLSPAGPLNVAGELAIALADHLMDKHFDIAVSRRMWVDHGFSQALQFLWGDEMDTPPVIPIFMNAVTQPYASASPSAPRPQSRSASSRPSASRQPVWLWPMATAG